MNAGSTVNDPETEEDLVMVASSQGHYPVFIGLRLLSRLGQCLQRNEVRARLGPRCALVSDRNVARLHGDAALRGLLAAGFDPVPITVPAGENSKSMAQVETLCEAFAAHGLDRRSFVAALGGGVVGDLAGFAAAVFQRGILCVQVPTSVTAQVDSAIGGKTGVNTAHAKNQIGAFHPPAAVVADVSLLETLPAREAAEGCAEAIKHAAIRDASLLDALCDPTVSSPDPGGPVRMTREIIRRNVEIKAGLVGQDEFEQNGRRALLNFGHTVGHGIESAAGYGRFLHGEAVSLGMVAAARLSVAKSGLPREDYGRLVSVLRRFGLPVQLPDELPVEAVLDSLRMDKKFEGGQIRFVLLDRLGEARLTAPGDVSFDDLRAAVKSLQSPAEEPALAHR